MSIISIRIEDQMKKELDELCEAMGMNVTTFFTIYAKKVLRDRKIPFDLEAPVAEAAVNGENATIEASVEDKPFIKGKGRRNHTKKVEPVEV